MRRAVIVNLVGMTPALLEHAPKLRALAESGACAPMTAVLPAVTCSAQASLLTGLSPQEHGAVGNGWMDPASREVALRPQANTLVSGEKLYETVKRREPSAARPTPFQRATSTAKSKFAMFWPAGASLQGTHIDCG